VYIWSVSELTIGKLAKLSSVSVETVRFYERKGLIEQPSKHSGAFRHYDSNDALRIRFIKRAQDLGFTLAEIKDLLEFNSSPRATCSDVRTKAERKLAEVESKIKDLQRMKRSLKRLAEACGESKQAASQCQILNCFESGWKCE
jgi:Hg(II)-responsive transcriptional regulator